MFIDTEASGLPKNWNLPFTEDNNWPHTMQLAWAIYDADKNQVKRENHYLKSPGVKVQKGALKIHGITPEFLGLHGESREEVLKLLRADIQNYHPLIVGHFIKLDYYILSADFQRAGLENPLHLAPVFCTMVATKRLAWNPMPKHLRLGELYTALFNAELPNQHNAIHDVEATAACFFELRKRGEITNEQIAAQNADFDTMRQPTGKRKKWLLPAMIVLLFIILIVYLL